MRGAVTELLREQKATLHSCSDCPVKGGCVFATPEYEPGYCLHEYKLLHAYMARRLRAHPPAGGLRFDRLRAEAAGFVERIKRESPRGSFPGTLPMSLAFPHQATLAKFT